MSSQVAGGKVWNMPNERVKKSQLRRYLLISSPFLLLGPVVIIAAHVMVATSASNHSGASVLGGYVEKVVPDQALVFFLPFVLAIMEAVVLLVFLGPKYLAWTKDWFEITLSLSLIFIPIVAAMAFSSIFLTGTNHSGSANEWAKDKYGYQSVDTFSKDSMITTVRKADGSDMRVGVLYSHNNFYLYENVDQLHSLEAELTAYDEAQ